MYICTNIMYIHMCVVIVYKVRNYVLVLTSICMWVWSGLSGSFCDWTGSSCLLPFLPNHIHT